MTSLRTPGACLAEGPASGRRRQASELEGQPCEPDLAPGDERASAITAAGSMMAVPRAMEAVRLHAPGIDRVRHETIDTP